MYDAMAKSLNIVIRSDSYHPQFIVMRSLSLIIAYTRSPHSTRPPPASCGEITTEKSYQCLSNKHIKTLHLVQIE